VRKTANALLEKRSGRAEVTSRIEYRAESVEGTVNPSQGDCGRIYEIAASI
jgi:hypothetical protein